MNKKVASLESQMDARVNEAVQQALSQRTIGAPQAPDVVISPADQRRSSCASMALPNVQLQIEAPAVEQMRYPVDDITIPTACEVHVRAKNISVHIAYGSALPVNPGSTIHGMPIPAGYTSVIVEQIIGTSGDNENLEVDFVGGDVEKTIGDALHGIVLWRKADIKLIANKAAPVEPSPTAPSPPDYDHNDNDDHDPSPSAPSQPEQRARSTPTPPPPEKGKKKTSSLPLVGPPNKKSKRVKKKR